ncbi:MAG: hypothetical protein KDC88_11395 [Ignavibacteriae bacterium]|nr:hypothetical protein [Ignavibacteriota bacterium]MCB9208323.1 hypothetical protein [Ignavibacteriales bacterium]MCB9259085.1 hypothetical protein [Ignavibacteriales bacterium]
MIKKFIIVLFLIGITISAQTRDFSNYRTVHMSVGAQFGMFNGVGFHVNFLTSNFADNFPFSAKLGFGFSSLDPGDPLAARRIFINNNTNGIPEQSGRTWDFNLDFLYRYGVLNLKRNYFYAGPRYTMFTGNFNYVGGNEDFDITSNLWGIGIGMENYFRIIPQIDLVVNFGYDYYFSNTLYGHDTSYSPSGEDINPREEYNFADADKAINQPKHQLKAMIGFNYVIQ